jgi:nitroreductase/NAD-dependent dihydropyrimidine dehydrogenase PreA subunit
MAEIKIITEKCKKCGTCVQICPLAVFELKDKTSNTEVLRADLCISCGQCVSLCLQAAIDHSDFPPEKINPIVQEILPTHESVLELLRGRRSVRAFRDKPVEKEIIEKVIEGAYLAPSAENYQSTEFKVVQNAEVLNKISKITLDFVKGLISNLKNKESKEPLPEKEKHSLKSMEWLIQKQQEGRDMFLFNAPAVLFFHSVTDVSFPEASVNLMLQNAAIISHSLGMGGFYTGYVVASCQNDPRINDLLDIRPGNKIFGAITIGYPKFKYKNRITRKTPLVEWV